MFQRFTLKYLSASKQVLFYLMKQDSQPLSNLPLESLISIDKLRESIMELVTELNLEPLKII
jgi:hypothetical protein